MRYRVYLWLKRSSQAAEVVQEVQSSTAPAALREVMHFHIITSAYYAWVVPENEAFPCVERYQVRCASARCRRQRDSERGW
jgi:hypothetical protein